MQQHLVVVGEERHFSCLLQGHVELFHISFIVNFPSLENSVIGSFVKI